MVGEASSDKSQRSVKRSDTYRDLTQSSCGLLRAIPYEDFAHSLKRDWLILSRRFRASICVNDDISRTPDVVVLIISICQAESFTFFSSSTGSKNGRTTKQAQRSNGEAQSSLCSAGVFNDSSNRKWRCVSETSRVGDGLERIMLDGHRLVFD